MLKYEVTINGVTLRFCRHGVTHRVDSPATIWYETDMFWYEYGDFHRIGGPAIITAAQRKNHFIRGRYYDWEEYELKIQSS